MKKKDIVQIVTYSIITIFIVLAILQIIWIRISLARYKEDRVKFEMDLNVRANESCVLPNFKKYNIIVDMNESVKFNTPAANLNYKEKAVPFHSFTVMYDTVLAKIISLKVRYDNAFYLIIDKNTGYDLVRDIMNGKVKYITLKNKTYLVSFVPLFETLYQDKLIINLFYLQQPITLNEHYFNANICIYNTILSYGEPSTLLTGDSSNIIDILGSNNTAKVYYNVIGYAF